MRSFSFYFDVSILQRCDAFVMFISVKLTWMYHTIEPKRVVIAFFMTRPTGGHPHSSRVPKNKSTIHLIVQISEFQRYWISKYQNIRQNQYSVGELIFLDTLSCYILHKENLSHSTWRMTRSSPHSLHTYHAARLTLEKSYTHPTKPKSVSVDSSCGYAFSHA